MTDTIQLKFEHINTINTIIVMAEEEIVNRTGTVVRLIICPEQQIELKRLTPGKTLMIIASVMGMKMNDFTTTRKREDQVRLRQIGCYILKKYFPDMSLKEIGKLMGGRDHTTVMWALVEAEKRLGNDKFEVWNEYYERALNALTQVDQ